jgi:hypothetical protein
MLCAIIRSQLVILESITNGELYNLLQQDANSVASSLSTLLQEAGALNWDFRSHASEIKQVPR